MRRIWRQSIRLRLGLASAALIAGFLGLSVGLVYLLTVGSSRLEQDRSVQREVDALLDLQATEGSESLEGELTERVQSAGTHPDFLYVYSESSRILVGNMQVPEGLEDDLTSRTFVIKERTLRAQRVSLADGRDLVVARDITQSKSYERRLLVASLAALGLAMLLAIAMGLTLSHNLLRRVERMNSTLVSILSGDREARVPLDHRDDEFEELARHFNSLLDENERLMREIGEVTDNIAHDLRTPLARVRSRIEAALAQPIDAGDAEDVLQDVLVETNSLLDTFHALLSIAKIESGSAHERMSAVDLEELTLAAIELYEPVAEEAGIQIEPKIEPGLVLRGNHHLLSQALSNLIDNAIKFSPRGTQIEVCACRDASGLSLCVADNGPGVPEKDRKRVLTRFVRLDASRQEPGTGLGLSLVSAIARLHGAELRLEDNQPGLRVCLIFPRVEQLESQERSGS